MTIPGTVKSAVGTMASKDNTVKTTAKRAAKRFTSTLIGGLGVGLTPWVNVSSLKAGLISAGGAAAGVVLDKVLAWANS